MPAYNVYLGDVNSGLNDETKNAVQTTLLGWFGRIVPSGTTAVVSWVSAAPASIQASEMLVYFVRGQFGQRRARNARRSGKCRQRRRSDGVDEFADGIGSLCQFEPKLSGGNGVSRVDAQQTASRRRSTSRPERSGAYSRDRRNESFDAKYFADACRFE